MQYDVNNTKKNIFKDEHLMSKIVALYIYIHIHIYIYIQIYRNMYTYIFTHMNTLTHLYKFIGILLCKHVYTNNHTRTQQVAIQCLTHYVGLFSFGSAKLRKSCNAEKQICILQQIYVANHKLCFNHSTNQNDYQKI